jgi:carbon storage regulator
VILGLTSRELKQTMLRATWSCFSAPLITRCLVYLDQAACPVWDKRSVTAAGFCNLPPTDASLGWAAHDRLPCYSKGAGGVCMLVLSRKIGQEIVIGNDIRITVVAVQGEKVRIGVNAPKEIVVDRQETHEKRNGQLSPNSL